MILSVDTLGDLLCDNRFSSHGGLLHCYPSAIIKASDIRSIYGLNKRMFKPFITPIGLVEPTSLANDTVTGYYSILSMHEDMDISEHNHLLTGNSYMLETKNTPEMPYIDGVPANFVNSFGNFLGLKYFLDGVKDVRDVHTYIDKNISDADFEHLKSLFKQCRYIYRPTQTEFEFYDADYGYAVVTRDKSIANIYTISCAVGFDELNAEIAAMGQKIPKSPMASWVTGVDSYGELNIKNFSLQSIYPYQSEFYPFMNGESIESFAKRYMESNSSILLLIGPPGTAKTNFIRQLLQETNESVLLTYSDDLKKTDKLFSYFYDSPEKFLIIEDADTYIEKREDGNSNMKQVLNITDGLTANPSKKVIFSTNLPSLLRVDPALIRPGRCFEKLQFGRITGDDLSKVIDVIGAEYFKDVKIPADGFTIAELFAIRNNEPIDIAATSTSFGFKR